MSFKYFIALTTVSLLNDGKDESFESLKEYIYSNNEQVPISESIIYLYY